MTGASRTLRMATTFSSLAADNREHIGRREIGLSTLLIHILTNHGNSFLI